MIKAVIFDLDNTLVDFMAMKHQAIDAAINAMIDAGLDQPEAQYGCPIANSYSRCELKAILDKIGFGIKSISKDHIFPYDVDKYKKYEYEKTPWFSEMPNEIFRVLERNFGWHLLVEASLT